MLKFLYFLKKCLFKFLQLLFFKFFIILEFYFNFHRSLQYIIGEIYNRSWFYGNAISTGNGTVQVTSPYTSGTSSGTLVVKNVDFSVFSSLTLTAAGTYPYNFSEWRTASGGGGTQLGTNANLTLTVSDHTSVENFYAYFT